MTSSVASSAPFPLDAFDQKIGDLLEPFRGEIAASSTNQSSNLIASFPCDRCNRIIPLDHYYLAIEKSTGQIITLTVPRIQAFRLSPNDILQLDPTRRKFDLPLEKLFTMPEGRDVVSNWNSSFSSVNIDFHLRNLAQFTSWNIKRTNWKIPISTLLQVLGM